MNLLVIGTGYVGLVTAACFAEMGHHVTCLDIDEAKIAELKRGKSPIFEPGLEELVVRNSLAGRLHFTTSYEEALNPATVCFIAVPTPSQEDGSCDLRYLFQVMEKITKNLLIVIKSTVPVGTCTKIKERFPGFEVVSNPEFLKEGSALSDCMKPDRIVIGTTHPEVIVIMKEIYSAFTINHDRLFFMDPKSAEMTKYAANAMLASRISFMNELSGLCEKLGANINDVRVGIGSDSRIGYQFLYAGVGYGGSCFPKDLRALQAMAREVNYDTPILNSIESINERQKQVLGRKILTYFQDKGGVRDKTIAIWGLSFKPDTDDIREAPALQLIKELVTQGALVRLYDPVAMNKTQKFLEAHPQVCYCRDEYEAALGAHAIALVTEWKQFRFVDFDKIQPKMETCALFDGRNQYKKQEMKQRGFDYFGIGIPH